MRQTLVMLALLSACSPAPESGRTPIRLALNWFPEPEFGGFYEGVRTGIYEAAGFDVEIVPGGPGAPTLSLLGAGKAQIAITSADDLLVKREKGVQAVAVWAAFQNSPQGLMVHANSPVQTLADIGQQQNARIAIEPGRPFQQHLWRHHNWNGVVEAVPYGGSIGPFLTDPAAIQQAYVTSEPCIAESKGAPVRFLSAADSGWNPYGTVVAVADPPPAWTEAFLAATATAWAAYLASPEATNAHIVSLNDQLDIALMDCISRLQHPFVDTGAPLGQQTAERWAGTVENLRAVGALSTTTSADGAWRPLP